MQPPTEWMPPPFAFNSWGEFFTVVLLLTILLVFIVSYLFPQKPTDLPKLYFIILIIIILLIGLALIVAALFGLL